MRKYLLAAALAAVAGPALAHTGHGASTGFVHGVLHPLTGADHLLAMLAVGLWSGFALTSRLWAGAAAFMGAMVAGAALSWAGVPLPGVEGMIAASVLAFGVLAAFAHRGQARWVTGASLGVIALFGICHGHAHASEATGAALAYLGGFLISTAALHLTGILVARAVAEARAARTLRRTAGGALVASGAWLLAG
ncbi:urease accessory protein UreJ [Rhodovulum sulfidophilum]|uniref:HupE/UreJ family protein n=1 Tax=Rhodovulum visakhapatnamense TaxID=364297 RepID=A0ABS1RCG9_9RHOB|nr:HupE/UreJ family protein [Rhodovulum visakhapatnamense]MBL3570366.1 HupE/UreJ family protein [Rhodovulum visakhapatnamense]MBL3576854.1 HupE/UreJ family protein [Rhodovulum visakhapatnamense]OLS43956.1 urease accessory protein UreJ [Rhodovulum sulfidophilum]